LSKLQSLKLRVETYDKDIAFQEENMQPNVFAVDPVMRGMRRERDKIAAEMAKVGTEDAGFELERLKQDVALADAHYEKQAADTEAQRKIVLAQHDKQQELSGLKSDLETNLTTQNTLALENTRMEVGQGLIKPRLQIVDRAQTPGAPIRPIKPLQIGLSFAVGLLLGVGLVAGFEFLDQSLRKPEQATAVLAAPLLAVLPRLPRRELVGSRGRLLLAGDAAGSTAFEAYRCLRVGVLGAEDDDRPLRVLLTASALDGEGKSMVAANLAAACARAGETVLLIDADLHRPALHRFFDVSTDAPGLVEVLEGVATLAGAAQPTQVANLSLLTVGDGAGVPPDILGTLEMHDLLDEAAGAYDRVVIDGPPLLGLADGRAVGQFVDGIVVVVRAGAKNDQPLRRLRQVCDNEGLPTAGVVFNGIREKHDDLTLLKERRRQLVQRRDRLRSSTAKDAAPKAVADAAPKSAPKTDDAARRSVDAAA
ncbi:MAG: tyrosine-protein kinase family protein, partial [Planctomycetia bacterium]